MNNRLSPPDPIEFLYEKYGFEPDFIEEIIIGLKYIAVLLKNGDIGLCATSENKIPVALESVNNIDIGNISHRIILNAYYNALINPTADISGHGDIFDAINFSKYNKIAMIGYFRPLAEKFSNEGIPNYIFDMNKSDLGLISMDKQAEIISESDAIILSATSIFNKTFCSIVNNANDNSDIYILGPSSILFKDFIEIFRLKMIFGMTFKKKDKRVTDVIKSGFGTSHFKMFAEKVYFK